MPLKKPTPEQLKKLISGIEVSEADKEPTDSELAGLDNDDALGREYPYPKGKNVNDL